ncbi:DUF4215 domain-containing protein [Candidatus Nomurabacteria bacterium]|nr:DUF4215 domain-containing protein [Candidatus Nomurabacteria bacterium]
MKHFKLIEDTLKNRMIVSVLAIFVLSLFNIWFSYSIKNSDTSFFAKADSANTYHVSVSGSDVSGLGTSDNPWRSIQKAADTVTAGDTVIVHQGTYNERIEITMSGTVEEPIIFQSDGEVIIDGGRFSEHAWVQAPEVGIGVWKIMKENDVPVRVMSIGEGASYKKIPGFYQDLSSIMDDSHLVNAQADDLSEHTGFEMIAYQDGQQTHLHYHADPDDLIDYWDPTEALFGNEGDYLYLHFRDNRNPNNENLKFNYQGDSTININGAYNVVIQGFKIYGGENGVSLNNGAQFNHIRNNSIYGGSRRIYLTGHQTSYNYIYDNYLNPKFLSNYQPGAWDDRHSDGWNEEQRYDFLVKEAFYIMYKYWFGPGGTFDYGIAMQSAGDYNEVYSNQLRNNLIGISIWGDATHTMDGIKIYTNDIEGGSSINILQISYCKNTEIHDNFLKDANINLRLHHTDEVGDNERSAYIYRNKFYNPQGVSSHIFAHRINLDDWPAGTTHPHFYIYHNSFTGAYKMFSGLSNIEQEGYPNVLFVNNIFSAFRTVYLNRELIQQTNLFGGFDYNWDGGEHYYYDPLPPWFGEHNFLEDGSYMWDASIIPNFLLPEDSLARESGIDISQSFNIDDQAYDPLPGFATNYFSGAQPDMGVYNIAMIVPQCSNSILESGETCDDGNLNNGDGCSSSCQIEQETPPPASCTDNIQNGNETGIDCGGSCSACDNGGGNEEINPPPPPENPPIVCGNSIIETGETCDDGNLNNGDGCSYLCQIEEDTPATTTPNSLNILYPQGFLAKASQDPRVYYINQESKRYYIPNLATFYTWFNNFNSLQTLDQVTLNNSYPYLGRLTVKPGNLVKFQDSNKVYAVEPNKTLRWITSANIFSDFGYDFNKIVNLPAEDFSYYTIGENITSSDIHPSGQLLKHGSYPQVFYVQDGIEYWIKDQNTFLSLGFKWQDIITIPVRYWYTRILDNLSFKLKDW